MYELRLLAHSAKGNMEIRAHRLLQRIYLSIQGLVVLLQRLLQAGQECELRQETIHYHLSSQLVNY